MAASEISAEPAYGSLATALPVADSLESAFQPEPLAEQESQEARLRRAHAELELLYALERQLSQTRGLGSILVDVLELGRSFLGVDVVAALIQYDTAGEVIVVTGQEPAARRALDGKQLRRWLGAVREPSCTQATALRELPELLCQYPIERARECFSLPITDGRAQIGVLQAVNRLDAAQDEAATIRRMELLAVQLGRTVLVARDREAAERAERLALLSGALMHLSHDVCAPLSSARQSLRLLLAEGEAETRAQVVARAERALDHVERMAGDVLAFARGQREIAPCAVQLPRFADEVGELLGAELERAGCTLRVACEYGGAARFDDAKLKRVLWNLARHACQAGADTFSWRCARVGERLMFECADNGRCIPVAERARLFDSFANHAGHGGLGFAMVKKIVDAHCGSICVSCGDDRGSVFRIELPL